VNLLPLVSCELRVALRRRSTYYVRLVAGMAAIAISFWALLIWADWKTPASLGHSLLEALALTGFIGVVLAGLVLTSDCISRERREGTLGLLFLTDLRGADVAFGKLAAKAILPFYALLAMFPALSVCLLVGGVMVEEVGRLALALLNTLFFSLSATLLTSALCRKQHAAQASACLMMLVCVPGLPLLGHALSAWTSNAVWRQLAFLFSPAGSYFLAFDKSYRGAAGSFWGSLMATHLFAWLALALSAFLLPRAFLENSSEQRQIPPAPWVRSKFRDEIRQRRLRLERLKRNPMAWLADRDRPRRRWVWCFPALALGLWIVFELDPLGNPAAQAGFVALASIHVFFKIWLSADASYGFATGRRDGTLELLLLTPLKAREIAAGTLTGFRRRYLAPLLALFLLDAALAAWLALVGRRPSAILVGAVGALLLVDSYCLCWVGMLRGLMARDSGRAILATLGRILLLPWLYFAFGATIFLESSPGELALLWLFLSGLNDLIFLANARSILIQHFRILALRPFGEKAPRVESQWSPINWQAESETSAKAAGSKS
jgi:ABC-type transport system involved in multi-copper enzyme maturation permease subunit